MIQFLFSTPKIMSLYEDAVAAAVKLPQAQREQLAAALGLKVSRSTPGASLPMVSNYAPPASLQASQQWRKAEAGHAVLADAVSAEDENLRDEEIPAGAAAISGIWQMRADELISASSLQAGSTPGLARAADLPNFAPVVLHHEVAFALACGEESAAQFFNQTKIEIRLTTAGYLALLGACQNAAQQKRVRHFVKPFAVLSLGPMASSRAVELMLEYSRIGGLTPLDALTAATALAYEIPLVAREANRFAEIDDLTVCEI